MMVITRSLFNLNFNKHSIEKGVLYFSIITFIMSDSSLAHLFNGNENSPFLMPKNIFSGCLALIVFIKILKNKSLPNLKLLYFLPICFLSFVFSSIVNSLFFSEIMEVNFFSVFLNLVDLLTKFTIVIFPIFYFKKIKEVYSFGKFYIYSFIFINSAMLIVELGVQFLDSEFLMHLYDFFHIRPYNTHHTERGGLLHMAMSAAEPSFMACHLIGILPLVVLYTVFNRPCERIWKISLLIVLLMMFLTGSPYPYLIIPIEYLLFIFLFNNSTEIVKKMLSFLLSLLIFIGMISFNSGIRDDIFERIISLTAPLEDKDISSLIRLTEVAYAFLFIKANPLFGIPVGHFSKLIIDNITAIPMPDIIVSELYYFVEECGHEVPINNWVLKFFLFGGCITGILYISFFLMFIFYTALFKKNIRRNRIYLFLVATVLSFCAIISSQGASEWFYLQIGLFLSLLNLYKKRGCNIN